MGEPSPGKKEGLDSSAEETAVTPVETLRSLELDDVTTPQQLARRCARASWRPLTVLALAEGVAISGLMTGVLGGAGAFWLLSLALPVLVLMAPLIVHLIGTRFLRYGPETSVTPVVHGVARRLRSGLDLVLVTGLGWASAWVLAYFTLRSVGGLGEPALELLAPLVVSGVVTGWFWLHVSARFALLEDDTRKALVLGRDDALRALNPFWGPGRRTWRRAVLLLLATGAELVLVHLAAVLVMGLLAILPLTSRVEFGLFLVWYSAAVLYVLNGWCLAWGYGYLSGEGAEQARLRGGAEGGQRLAATPQALEPLEGG